MRVPCQDKKFHPYFQQSFARKRCFVINKRKLEGTRRQMKNTTFAYKLLLEKAAGINFSFLEIRLDSLPRTKPLFTLGLITHPSFFMSFIQFGVERVFYTALFRGWSSQFFKSEFSYCCDSSEASFLPSSIHPSFLLLSFFLLKILLLHLLNLDTRSFLSIDDGRGRKKRLGGETAF